MKFYKKSKLKYVDGYLTTKKGKIVMIDNEIIDLANELEERYQRALWEIVHPEPEIDTNAPEFKRLSERKPNKTTLETPYLDEKTEQTMKIMEEIDALSKVHELNNDLLGMKPLLDFVKSDKVIECESGTLHRFDLPILGDPLKLSAEDIVKFELDIHHLDQIEYDGYNDDEDEDDDEEQEQG